MCVPMHVSGQPVVSNLRELEQNMAVKSTAMSEPLQSENGNQVPAS